MGGGGIAGMGDWVWPLHMCDLSKARAHKLAKWMLYSMAICTLDACICFGTKGRAYPRTTHKRTFANFRAYFLVHTSYNQAGIALLCSHSYD